MDTTPYNATITVGWEKAEHKEHIQNVGSMDNAKRHARRIANKLKLKPHEPIWTTLKTYFAPDSGLYGSWESEAYRIYKKPNGDKIPIKITRV